MNVNYNSLSAGRDTLLKNGIGDSVGSPPISNSKAMKKSWLVMLVMLLSMTFGQMANSQTLANYVYATGTTGSLEDLSAGATTIMTGRNDDLGGTVTAIGFNFPFMGQVFTHFSANSNGQMMLHASALATAAASQQSSPSAGLAILAPMTGDNEVGNGIRIRVFGTAPNRKLVVEWNQFNVNFVDITNAGNMQVWIEETTGIVTYMYGEIFNSSATAQSRSTFIASSNTATSAGSITLAAVPTFALGATSAVNTIAGGSGTTTGSPLVANLGSAAQGSRRFFTFTPNAAPVTGDASTLTIAIVSANALTPSWVDDSTGESFFVVTRALDAGFTTGVVVANVASATSGTVGTSYSLPQTGLSPGTTYFYKIQAATEVVLNTGVTGSQTTTAGTTYFWVGASGSPWTLASNWNTIAVGGGSTRATPLTTDVLIVDGAGIVAGGALIIPVGASATIGQLRVTSGTALTLQSDTTTQRVLTISGGGAEDFGITAGSTLSLSSLTNTISIVFSGTGNTGLIDGTLNVHGNTTTASTSNSFLTTGGTGTVVTVSSGGIVNNNATSNIATNGNVTGSAATLVFAAGSAYNATGATALAFWLPLATWNTTSTVTVSGIIGSTTTATNANQSFGNFVYNCPGATGSMNIWGATTTAVVKGNLTVTAGAVAGTGIMRAVSTGTVNINGNVTVLQGRFQSQSSTGTTIVSGDTTINAGGILDVASGTYSQRGATFTNSGTLASTTGTLQFVNFAGSFPQTLTGAGLVTGNFSSINMQNTAGLTISHAAQIPTLRVNLFQGTITGSSKITIGTGLAAAAIVQIGSNGLTTSGGSFDANPTMNLGTGTYQINYSGETTARTTGFEIPATRTASFVVIGNNNNVTLAGGALNIGTLILSGGKFNTSSSNVPTVTGVATTSTVRSAYTSGATSSSSGSTVTVSSTTNLVEGMIVSVTAGTGAFAANTTVVSVVNATTFTVSAPPSIALSGATVAGIGGWVNGPLALTLPASFATAATYTFPIGKASFNTFALVNPTTNAGGTVIVQAEAFDGNAGGTPGLNISAVSTTKYWAASITAGAANLIGSLVQLNDVSTGRDAIAASATQAGAYDLQGGVAITTTATSLTTTAPANSTLPGFFLMANKAAANITNVVIAPVGNLCTNVARTITADVTPGGGTVTSVVINYTVNGVAGPGSPIAMTATTSNGFPLLDSYTGTIPTVTPANAAVVWSITATDSNLLTKNVAGTGYSDEPLFTLAATATASVTNICNVGSSLLTATIAGPATATIGAAATLTGATTQPTAFCNRWPSYRMQTVYTAAELSTAGLSAGPITAMSFFTTTLGDGATNSGFVVKVGTTALSVLSGGSFQSTTGYTTVFPSATYTHTASGEQIIPFSTPFVWDGTSNIIIDMIHNGADATNNSITFFTATAGNTVAFTSTDASNAPSFSTQRLNVKFAGTGSQPITSVLWSNGDTGVTTTVSPLVTTSYTAAITAGAAGCSKTTNSVTVNVNPLPTVLDQTVFTSTCGTGVPLVAVSDPNAFVTPLIKWYAADGTTLLQNNVATTFLGSISVTTTFKVSVVNPANGCESPQLDVIATVLAPAAIDPIANQTVCLAASFAVSATSINPYTYTWTALPAAGSGIPTTLTGDMQTILPTAVGTYTYTVSGTDGVCNTSTTFTATVNAFPTLSGATASPAAVCANGISTLTATVPGALIFAATTGASLDPMTGAATVLGSSNDDTVTAAPVNIGFSFTFNGVAFTQYQASPDGWISLGATAGVDNFSNSITNTSNVPRIAPMWDDLATGTTGSVTAVTTGIAPNRILKVQWFVTSPRDVGGAANSTFQAWLYEGSNKIEYRYGTIGNPGSASGGYTIAAANFSSLTFATNTQSTVTANNSNAAAPVSGTMYSYTLPVPGNVTWAPITDLYTDALATVPYTGTNAATVYSKPTATRIYNANLAANGCVTTSSNVTVTQNAEFVNDPTGPIAVCLGSPTIPAGPITYTNGEATTSYFSSNPAVATINIATGVLTPLTAGTTNISCQNINLTTGCTSAAVNVLAVTVSAPISITTNPLAQTVLEYDGVNPTTTTFSAAASGSVASYRWRVSPTGGSGSYVDIADGDPLYSGQATATLTISNATIAVYSTLYYLCAVTPVGPCAPVLETTGALLTVSDLTTSDPTFTTPICGMGSHSFTTVSVPPTGVTYKWYYATNITLNDAAEITGDFGGLTFPSGVTSATLVVDGLSITENGYYFFVVAETALSSVQSNPALVVVNTPQTVGPTPVADKSICFNAVTSSTFTVTSAGGSGFQWEFSADGTTGWANVSNSTPAGATYLTPTGATLTVNTTAALAVGTYFYRCVVSGPTSCPVILSNVASLIVTTPTISAVASVPTICNSGSSVLTASGAGVGGTYAWTASASLAAPLNLDTVTATPTTTTTYSVTGTTAEGCISAGTVTVSFGSSPAGSIVTGPTTVCSGAPTSLDASNIFASSGGAAPAYCAVLNGGTSNVNSVMFNTLTNAFAQTTPFVNSFPASGATTTTVAPGSTHALTVTTDALSIASVWIDFNRDGIYGASEHTQLWTSATSGTVNITIPALATAGNTGMRIRSRSTGSPNGPTDSCSQFFSGSTQDYTITIGSNVGYTYSWSSVPAGFSASTSSVVVNPTVDTTYSVLITTPLGCSASPSQLITVASAVAILGQPQPATFCQGTTASLSVGATGAGLTYQWRKGGVDIFGEISSSITFPAADLTVAGSYDVIVGDECGSTPLTSSAAVLTIIATPTVNAVSAQTSCAVATTAVALSGSTTTFNISGGAAIGLADATGVAGIPSFTGIAGSATISVTPVVTSGATTCTGTPVTFLYTINANPASPTASSNSPSCDGIGNIDLTASSVTIPGYSMNGSSGIAFVDISVTGTNVPTTLGAVADDSEHPITIPSFTYNGVAYTTALVGNNGAMAFGVSTGTITHLNTALPATVSVMGGGTGAALMPFWDDLLPGGSTSIKTQTIGSITYIQWSNEDNFNATGVGTVTFQVQLDSSNGKVHFVYSDVTYGAPGFDGGESSTVGIQLNSTQFVQYSVNTNSVVTNQSITFTPNAPSYSWTGPNGFTASVQNPNTPSVALAAGTYSVTTTNVATGCVSAPSTTVVVVNTPTTWYADADADGFGDLTVTQLACTQPVGFVANSTDCNPALGTVWQTVTRFIDADLDTYGSTATGSVCIGLTTPAGYSENSLDCDDTNALLNPTNPCPTNSIVNLTLFIEGYYTGSSIMNSRMLNQWDGVTPVIAPSALDVEVLTVRLHDATTYATMFTTTGTLKTDGTLSASFAGAPSGSFFISVRGVNMIETWSAAVQAVGTTPLSYNFSTAASQAYGDNMREIETGIFAFYQGDLNQDGALDNTDLDQILPDIDNSAFGELATDLNGDGALDNQDLDNIFGNIDNSLFSNNPLVN